ncbi:unnamed protein product [Didymodactylos carnosus]|uniref:Uncharacterized protein n=2 Tax=Didymodactylos carnosus TaxID=1234261 RepID=A0A8S2LV68_9BILA|nr:unnamed protein product [Didymodactylos carnosus]CAF3918490.1 unnamed protein product [Didymodactylos carnosus]
MSEPSKIEDLSDDLFMSVLEYCGDVISVHKSWNDLNPRINLILNDHRLNLHIDLQNTTAETNYYYLSLLMKCRHQLISLKPNFDNTIQLFSTIHNLQEFTSLRSLILTNAHLIDLKYVLEKSKELPALTSLSLDTTKITSKTAIRSLCKMLFDSPSVKILKLNLHEYWLCFDKVTTTSNIEQLILQKCDLNDLFDLFPYVPKLRRLSIHEALNVHLITDSLQCLLSSLTYLNVFLINISFDKLKLLLRFVPNIRTLVLFGNVNDRNYLNKSHWKSMLLQSLKTLRVNITVALKQESSEIIGIETQFQKEFWLMKSIRFHIYANEKLNTAIIRTSN